MPKSSKPASWIRHKSCPSSIVLRTDKSRSAISRYLSTVFGQTSNFSAIDLRVSPFANRIAQCRTLACSELIRILCLSDIDVTFTGRRRLDGDMTPVIPMIPKVRGRQSTSVAFARNVISIALYTNSCSRTSSFWCVTASRKMRAVSHGVVGSHCGYYSSNKVNSAKQQLHLDATRRTWYLLGQSAVHLRNADSNSF